MDELRCETGKLHGVMVSPGVIEFKCNSTHCGAGSGVVVLHRFDGLTGELISTDRFAEPPRKETGADGSQHHSAAVRSA